MMLAAREDEAHLREWLSCGGKKTLASYSILGDDGKLVDVPDNHWRFFEEACKLWHETERHFFVHANASPDRPLADQPLYMLLWEFSTIPGRTVPAKSWCAATPTRSPESRVT